MEKKEKPKFIDVISNDLLSFSSDKSSLDKKDFPSFPSMPDMNSLNLAHLPSVVFTPSPFYEPG